MNKIRGRTQLQKISVGLCIVIGLLLLTMCNPDEPPPPATLTPTAQPPVARVCQDVGETDESLQLDAEPGRYIAGQVIVSGDRALVDELVDALPISLLVDCDLSVLNGLVTESDQELVDPLNPLIQANPVMRLYQVDDGSDGVELVDVINEEGNTRGVYADLNYLISPSGDAYGVSGDPWSGWSEPLLATEVNICDQWALGYETGGIQLTEDGKCPAIGGQGIMVGVFDTSPFAENSRQVISQAPVAFTLLVEEVATSLRLSPLGVSDNIIGHGLFVSGLVHVVAPESEIHLYPVLNGHGEGHLLELNMALINFLLDYMVNRENMNGAVANLSLGVHAPDDKIATLEFILDVLRNSGVIVVAASGNDSYSPTHGGSNHLHTIQYPAGFDGIIAVTGNTVEGQRACFANGEDEGGKRYVSAPSGNGASIDDEIQCDPWWNSCTDTSCEYGVVSYYGEGFAYWAGTSFSTALASGLAARSLSESGGVSVLSPAGVEQAIFCGAINSGDSTLSMGTIKVDETIAVSLQVATGSVSSNSCP